MAGATIAEEVALTSGVKEEKIFRAAGAEVLAALDTYSRCRGNVIRFRPGH